MKNIIAIILALTSVTSNAELLNNPSPEAVLDAVVFSIKSHDLNCNIVNVNAANQQMKASRLSFGMMYENLFASINSNGAQPILTLTSENQVYKHELIVTTNVEQTIVTELKFVSSTKAMGKVNTGTITNPKIEDQMIYTVTQHGLCQ